MFNFPWFSLTSTAFHGSSQSLSMGVQRFFKVFPAFLPAFSTESSSNDSYFSRFSQEFRCSTLLPSSPHCHPLPTVSAARASSLSAAPSAASRKTAKASACFFYTRKSLEYVGILVINYDTINDTSIPLIPGFGILVGYITTEYPRWCPCEQI